MLFSLCSYQAYADSPVPALEKKMMQRYKETKKLCNNIDGKTDKEKIDCLLETVRYLQARIDLHYNYYINTLTITNVGCYNGGVKNCWE